MKIDMLTECAALDAMTIPELLKEWPRYFDVPPKSRSNKKYLMSEMLYRIQEMTYGGLSKKTIDRLEALAESKLISQRKYDDSRLAVGTRLVREVKGVEHQVTVLEEGYEYNGTKYKSLSGVAFAITGTRWNGNAFFGLTKNRPRPYQKSKRLGR